LSTASAFAFAAAAFAAIWSTTARRQHLCRNIHLFLQFRQTPLSLFERPILIALLRESRLAFALRSRSAE